MKKLLQLLFLVQFTLISCNKKSENKASDEKVIIEKTKNSKIDTTRIRNYAKLILENKIYPSDNDETFECIKQMFTRNKNDLEFYFKVFRIIVDKSDGALSEAIGLEITNFFKYNPDFFVKQYTNFKLKEKEKFIDFMAYEFYFTEPEHNEEIDIYFSEVNSNLKQDTEPKRKHLNAIKELIKIATEKIIND